jgi:hypothetical protein
VLALRIIHNQKPAALTVVNNFNPGSVAES